MPWQTPTLKDTRRLTRDYVLSQLGAKAMIPNSALRIMSDAMAGLGNLAYLYLDWLAKQLMPDTAEKIWLDRFGIIWLTNADGSKGRKAATYASGQILFQGIPQVGIPPTVPVGALLNGINAVQYQTTTEAMIDGSGQGTANAVALTAGAIGNLSDGDGMTLVIPIANVTSAACFGDMLGGVDQETDDQLRERILFRIQNPPMGGSAADYVSWAMSVPGVTRAWCAPMEMGIGTVTVRFLMDDTYPDNHGLPMPSDVEEVSAYVNSKRPVTVEDRFVLAPILFFYDVVIRSLSQDTPTVRAAIEASIATMEYARSAPGQTMYRSWVDEAISQALGENSHELDFETQVMPAPGYMPTLGTIFYADDQHVTRTGDDYAEALQSLLPLGQAWPRDNDSVLMKVVRGLCGIWGNIEGRASALLEVESDPRLTVELLPDWERNWGLPDPCYTQPLTIHDRQLALVARMTMLGAQSRQFFIDLAAFLGYTITISEYSPFMAGVSNAGDTRTPPLDPRPLVGDFRWYIGPPEMRYFWTVHVTGARLTWFRSAQGVAGVDHHLEIGLAEDLECLFQRWKPAHTEIVFDYSNIGGSTDDPMAGTP